MKTPLWFVVLAGLTGCLTAPSTAVGTTELIAHISGLSEGLGSTHVSTALQLDAATYVDLESPDTLTASSAGEARTMVRSNVLGLIRYSAAFAGDGEDKLINVALKRKGTRASAPASAVSMPAPFQVLAPATSQRFARATDFVEVAWSNAGKPDPMAVSVYGPCIIGGTHTVDGDAGRFAIPPSSFATTQEDAAKTCAVTLTVERRRAGVLDPAFGQGTIAGVQRRFVTITSAPR